MLETPRRLITFTIQIHLIALPKNWAAILLSLAHPRQKHTMTQPAESQSDLTTLLHAWRAGSDPAFSALIDRVYGELTRIAATRLNQFGGHATLTPTDLLHEALIGIMPTDMDFKNRAHFFATMSLAIRSILVDHARARSANKRGGDMIRVTLTNADVGEESMALDLLANRLEVEDARCAQVMHLTYFGGLEQEAIATLLDVSIPTVKRDLRFARAWLTEAMSGGSGGNGDNDGTGSASV
jgi:RNA polymerase sigma factor (TIGR02999 family)